MRRAALLLVAALAPSCLQLLDLDPYRYSCEKPSDCAADEACVLGVCEPLDGGSATGGGGSTGGGSTGGGSAGGGSAGGGSAGGGSTGGGSAGGGSAVDAGPPRVLPVGHCSDAGWCWVEPYPVSAFQAVAMTSASTGWVVANDGLFRWADGGLHFAVAVPPEITDLAVRPTGEVFIGGSNDQPRQWLPTLGQPAPVYGPLAVAANGAVWVMSRTQAPHRWTGTTWTTPTLDPCSDWSDAPTGTGLVRYCASGPSGELAEYAPAKRVIEADAGRLGSIAASSATVTYAIDLDFSNGGVVSFTSTGARTLIYPTPFAFTWRLVMQPDSTLVLFGGLVPTWIDSSSVGLPINGTLGMQLTLVSAYGGIALVSDSRSLVRVDIGANTQTPIVEDHDDGIPRVFVDQGDVLLTCATMARSSGAMPPLPNIKSVATGADGERILVSALSLYSGDGGDLASPAAAGSLFGGVTRVADGGLLLVGEGLQGRGFAYLRSGGAWWPVTGGLFADGGTAPLRAAATTHDAGTLVVGDKLVWQLSGANLVPFSAPTALGQYDTLSRICSTATDTYLSYVPGSGAGGLVELRGSTWSARTLIGEPACGDGDRAIVFVDNYDRYQLRDGGEWLLVQAPLRISDVALIPDGGFYAASRGCRLVMRP